METGRRQYSEEFKREAVQHCLASEKSVGEVAGDLGIAYSNLKKMVCPIPQKRRTGLSRPWQRKTHFPGGGKQKTQKRA